MVTEPEPLRPEMPDAVKLESPLAGSDAVTVIPVGASRVAPCR